MHQEQRKTGICERNFRLLDDYTLALGFNLSTTSLGCPEATVQITMLLHRCLQYFVPLKTGKLAPLSYCQCQCHNIIYKCW